MSVKLAQLDNMSEIDSFVLACALADERVNDEGQFEADLLEKVGKKAVEDGPAYDVEDLMHHGVWAFYSEELGWVPNTVDRKVHRQMLTRLPWLICTRPPLRQETVVEFRDRRRRRSGNCITRRSRSTVWQKRTWTWRLVPTGGKLVEMRVHFLTECS